MDNSEKQSPLAQLPHPSICQHCRNLAYWTVEHKPLCYLHLRVLADTGEDIAAILNDALISPELVSASTNEVRIRVYTTTCMAPVCALLNNFMSILPSVDCEAEIIIEMYHARPSLAGSMILMKEGMGWYYIDSTSVRCNAPLIKLARAPIGAMSGFTKFLNDHSTMVRKCVGIEFREEEAANG